MKKMPKTLFVMMFLASGAFAQQYTLPEALKQVDKVGSVVLAKLEVEDAQANLTRTLSDPLLTRPTEIQARQRLKTAQVKYDDAVRQAQSQIVSAYTGVLEAQEQVTLAEKSTDVLEQALKIAQIRQKNGSGTALDVRDAERQLADAEKNVAAAKNGLSLSKQNLANLIGKFEKIGEQLSLPELPKSDAIAQIVERSPNTLQLLQAVELTQMQLDLLDPSYAAQTQIDSAKSSLTQAQQNLSDIRNSLKVQAQSLYDNLLSAQKGYQVAVKARENAREQLASQKKRLSGGLISPFDFMRAELTDMQAELSLVQARDNYLKAYYAFLAGSGGR
ncbi:TolC family protein [Deinococcus cellulosilyticus]|uniref:Transporter n=1 Tax=Deinococcus cellulosilyticus (strain DSM 18568 / NBRC 106333 / KACC 11606 / 5516J-15) TaxID=1223518 RepID=A0A511NAY2_DEIC1|nr:TolC family protein [Deinococcus cellulosilyticus]GEM49970.1 transporter [Deinococcus cellulosilyticus NBRC 106333 = KACC 11606]